MRVSQRSTSIKGRNIAVEQAFSQENGHFLPRNLDEQSTGDLAADFGAATNFATGSQPYSVALEDINADGNVDIVTANNGVNTVSVLLGAGSGDFAAKTDFLTGTQPYSVELGDVNNDGKIDIVTANRADNTVSVLLGTGTGSFDVKTDFATGSWPVFVALGDVNKDGKLDIVTANRNDNTASVLLNAGEGSFGNKVDFTTGEQPNSIALGDVNRDGKLDIVAVNRISNTASILLGAGTGSFSPKTDFATGEGTYSVTLEDLNNDGKLDIVTANSIDNTASVLLGTGLGSFSAKVDFMTGAGPNSIALMDVNKDGKFDIVTTNVGANTASVLLGTGSGSFGGKADFTVGDNPYSIALTDVNKDGSPDIVIANRLDNTASVLLNQNNFDLPAAFGTKTDFSIDVHPHAVALGDVNGDGKLDIVTANLNDNMASVLLGTGAGSFSAKVDFSTGAGPNSIVLMDVNKDGKLDIVTANRVATTVSVLLGTGTGDFSSKFDFQTADSPAFITLGDVNNDGNLDILTANWAIDGTVSILLGTGTGSFSDKTDLLVGKYPHSIALGDVNEDGKLDIVAINYSALTSTGSAVSVLLGAGTGSFGSKVDFVTGYQPYSVALDDVNEDGKLDILTANAGSSTVSVLLGTGTGGFNSKSDFQTGNDPQFITLGDVNEDGKLDILTAEGTVSVLLGTGTGSFDSRISFVAGYSPYSIALGDVNEDGKLDIVAANYNDNTVSVLLNEISFSSPASTPSPSSSLTPEISPNLEPSSPESTSAIVEPSIAASSIIPDISESLEPSEEILPSSEPVSPSLAESTLLPITTPSKSTSKSATPSALPSSASPTPTPTVNNSHLALMLGFPIGSLFILLVVFGLYFYRRQSQHRRPHDEENSEAGQELLTISEDKSEKKATIQAEFAPDDYLYENDAASLCDLGLMYRDGQDRTRSYKNALYYFKKAAKQNHREATYHLAQIYEGNEDIGVVLPVIKRLEKAIKYYQKAIAADYVEANLRLQETQYKLAQHCASHQQVERAVSLYEGLVQAGRVDAALALGQLYENANPIDFVLALKWYQTYEQQRPVQAKPHISRLYGKQANQAEQQMKPQYALHLLKQAQGYDTLGQSLLHLAVIYDCDSVLDELLEASVHDTTINVQAKNQQGKTPLELAEERSNYRLQGALQEAIRFHARVAADEERFQSLLAQLRSTRQASSKSFLATEEQELRERIKSISQEDVINAAIEEIHLHIKSLNIFTTDINYLKPLLAEIQQPEILVAGKRDISLQLKDWLADKESRYTLKPLDALCQKLDTAIQKLSQNAECIPIANQLSKVKQYYQVFKQQLNMASTSLEKQKLLLPKASIHGAGLKHRHLTSEAADKLAVEENRENRDNAYGIHTVREYNGVHYKINPYAPGVEFMVNSLAALIAGHGTPPTELLKIMHIEHAHAYLASKTVQGINLDHLLIKHPELITKIDTRNFTGLCIISLLTNPHDAKPDNFMAKVYLDEHGTIDRLHLVGIDNDLSFADTIIKKRTSEHGERHFVNVKNVLYFFPQMDKEIDRKFCEDFLSASPEVMTIQWLESLAKKNELYQSLLQQGIIDANQYAELKLPIQLLPTMATDLCQKLMLLQAILRENRQVTHRQLFARLEPHLEAYYRNLQKTHPEPRQALVQLYRDAAPTVEDVLSLRSRLSSQQALMSKLACHNAKTDDFENNRVQSIKVAMEEFITSINLPKTESLEQKSIAGYIGSLYLIEHLKLTNDSLLQRLPLAELAKKFAFLKQITLESCHTVTVKDIVTVLANKSHLQLSLNGCEKINKAKHWQAIAENCQRFTLVIEGCALAVGGSTPSALSQQAQAAGIYTGELQRFLTWLVEREDSKKQTATSPAQQTSTAQFLNRQQQHFVTQAGVGTSPQMRTTSLDEKRVGDNTQTGFSYQ